MTPLFYKDEIVMYKGNWYTGKKDLLCVILVAQHYGRTEFNNHYKERYIIKSLQPEIYDFECNISSDTREIYYNVNKCAGEYLKKIDTKNPLYSFDIEGMFEELYKNQTLISDFNCNEYR